MIQLSKPMYFYLSLGSNIDTDQSAAMMIKHLCREFGDLVLYPFCYTKPESIQSEQDFVNALVVLRSNLNAVELKRVLVTIETSMGRDRQDPLRSYKSRAADIDILSVSEHFDLAYFAPAEEAYVRSCLCLTGPFVDLRPWGLAAHQRPASVYLDAATGEVVIVEDELHRFKHGFETAFLGN